MINLISWFLFMQLFSGFQPEKAADTQAENKLVKQEQAETTNAENSFVIYQELADNNASVPSPEVFRYAMNGYDKIRKENEIRENIITVIDFSLPSTEKRMWVIDLENRKVLFNNLVAHGRGSGNNVADKFSNVHESYKSSIGFYLTNELYTGKHGLSLRLDGLEEGFNDNARDRAIVMHGASYVDESLISSQGRIGRSLGCPAVPEELNEEIVNTISSKSVMFLYYPDYFYIKQSAFYNYASNVQENLAEVSSI